MPVASENCPIAIVLRLFVIVRLNDKPTPSLPRRPDPFLVQGTKNVPVTFDSHLLLKRVLLFVMLCGDSVPTPRVPGIEEGSGAQDDADKPDRRSCFL